MKVWTDIISNALGDNENVEQHRVRGRGGTRKPERSCCWLRTTFPGVVFFGNLGRNLSGMDTRRLIALSYGALLEAEMGVTGLIDSVGPLNATRYEWQKLLRCPTGLIAMWYQNQNSQKRKEKASKRCKDAPGCRDQVRYRAKMRLLRIRGECRETCCSGRQSELKRILHHKNRGWSLGPIWIWL